MAYSHAHTTGGPEIFAATATKPKNIDEDFLEAEQLMSDRLVNRFIDVHEWIPLEIRLLLCIENPAYGDLKHREVG